MTAGPAASAALAKKIAISSRVELSKSNPVVVARRIVKLRHPSFAFGDELGFKGPNDKTDIERVCNPQAPRSDARRITPRRIWAVTAADVAAGARIG